MMIDSQQVSAEQLAKTASELDPLPQTTSRIMTILADPLYEFSDLIKVIALDQPLTAHLLRFANSAVNSRGRDVSSVGEAVLRLGSGTILVMALSSSAKPPADIDLSVFGLSVDEYWRHCVGSVAAAEELSARRIARFGSGFSTAALLHDFGKLILSKHITPDRLKKLAAFQSANPGSRPIDAERTVLGNGSRASRRHRRPTLESAGPDCDRNSKPPRPGGLGRPADERSDPGQPDCSGKRQLHGIRLGS